MTTSFRVPTHALALFFALKPAPSSPPASQPAGLAASPGQRARRPIFIHLNPFIHPLPFIQEKWATQLVGLASCAARARAPPASESLIPGEPSWNRIWPVLWPLLAGWRRARRPSRQRQIKLRPSLHKGRRACKPSQPGGAPREVGQQRCAGSEPAPFAEDIRYLDHVGDLIQDSKA